jgi:4-hydroxybenzoate polyprenyltransferase
VWPFFVHLRLHFQFVLSGIFLWGYLLGGGVPRLRGLFAFLILHVFLYGGATAFNAYFDQDQGPIAGLRRPPPAGPICLWGGLTFMLVGAALAWGLGATFGLIYLFMLLLGFGYSHPYFRFKNGPISSILVVAIGQGLLGYLGGGAAAVSGGLPPLGTPFVLGALTSLLITTGLYPLTQVYQIDEDRRRGDRTFAVRYGPAGVFRTSLICFVLGGIAGWPAMRAALTPGQALGLAGALALLAGVLFFWSPRFDPRESHANHDRVFLFALGTSLSFVAVIAWRLAERIG